MIDVFLRLLFITGRLLFKLRIVDVFYMNVSFEKGQRFQFTSVERREGGGQIAGDGSAPLADVFQPDVFIELLIDECFKELQAGSMIEYL